MKHLKYLGAGLLGMLALAALFGIVVGFVYLMFYSLYTAAIFSILIVLGFAYQIGKDLVENF